MKGKLAYMAPVVIQHGRVDGRSDVWSLGVVAWELLTGTRLTGPARSNFDPPIILPPSLVAPDVPQAVSDAVMLALQERPDRRYQNAGAFARALRAAHRSDSPRPALGLDGLLYRYFDHHPGCYQQTLKRVDLQCPPEEDAPRTHLRVG